jgi:TolB-like protein/Tfp pilus assembly protein PilF/predicted Ser/Thr protein kinase
LSELLEGMLSHYRIVSLLGAGGMGTVYRAHDERLGRDLALKVLPCETMADVTARARLIQEARMASSLNHPHIAHVYDVGEDRDHVFIAMELVEGRQLRELIPPGGLSTGSLLQYGAQIADALAHAHEHGVIHRDLKSANIVITPEGRAKILDFGLAKRLHGDDEKGIVDLNLTASGMVMGTPIYLPPEVLLGHKADARSDVWALGVVLYEMASGKLPFGGDSLAELSAAITNAPPIPLSGHVPVGIQAVIARCLAKDPSQRYHSGGEARAAIETLMGAKSPRAAGPVARRVWLPAAGIAVLALVLAIAFNGGLRDRILGRIGGPRIGSLAVLPLANLSGDPAQEYFADGMTEELITDLAPIPSLKVISRTSIMRFKNSKEALRTIARTLGVDAIVEGSVLRAGNRVRITAQLIEASSDHHLWAKSYERDFQDVLTLQSEVASDIAQEIRLQVSETVKARLAKARPINPEAYELYLRGRYEWNKVTEDGMRKGIEYFEKALALDPGDARYSSGLADAYVVLVQVVGSVPSREGMAKVQQYARRALAADENSAEAHTSIAAALFFGDWKWKEAEQHLRRAIEINPGYPIAHLVYSALLISRGRSNEALAQDRIALELDPLSTIINWNAIGTLCQSRRYDDALAQAHRALALDPSSPLIHGSMVHICELKGDFAGALDLLDRYLPESEGGKARVAATRRAYAASGKTGYWRANLDYWLSRRNDSPASEAGFAMLYTQLGDHDRAIEFLERAYAKRSGDMLYVGVEPHFDPLRGDPRFQALVRRVGTGSGAIL